VVNLLVAVAPGRPLFWNLSRCGTDHYYLQAFGDGTKVVFIFSLCSCYKAVMTCTYGPSDALEYNISRLEAPEVS
jgi:hypothetical protein